MDDVKQADTVDVGYKQDALLEKPNGPGMGDYETRQAPDADEEDAGAAHEPEPPMAPDGDPRRPDKVEYGDAPPAAMNTHLGTENAVVGSDVSGTGQVAPHPSQIDHETAHAVGIQQVRATWEYLQAWEKGFMDTPVGSALKRWADFARTQPKP